MSRNTATAKLPMPTSVMRGAIVGVSGSGKGNASKAWCAEALKFRNEAWMVRADELEMKGELEAATELRSKATVRLVCFDPCDEYSVHGKKSDQIHLGPLTHRATFEEFQADPERWLDVADLALAVIPDDDDDVAAEQCADFVDLVRPTGNLTVVVDELGGFAFGNKKASISQKALNTLATKGRHDGISLVFVSQRLVHVPTSARASITAIETFNQTSPADLSALEELTGRPELAEIVSKQEPGESVLWLSPMLKKSKPKQEQHP